jgi:hypothetical protein
MIRLAVTRAFIPQQLFSQLSPEQADQVVDDVAAGAYRHWQRLASADSSSFRGDYLNGLQEGQRAGGSVVISLVGQAANLLEHGAPAMDLRDILLGPNVPVVPVGERGMHMNLEGGYFRAIPFRHTTPGSAAAPRGKASGQEMGAAYRKMLGEARAKKLGREVYRQALQLKAPTTGQPGQRPTYGSRLPAGLAPKLREHHKTDIYAGMIRERKTYGQTTSSQFMTFRTISTSTGEGWMRKRIDPRKYAEKTRDWVVLQMPRAVELLLRKAGRPVLGAASVQGPQTPGPQGGST